jgi:hypothetical protein
MPHSLCYDVRAHSIQKQQSIRGMPQIVETYLWHVSLLYERMENATNEVALADRQDVRLIARHRGLDRSTPLICRPNLGGIRLRKEHHGEARAVKKNLIECLGEIPTP